MTWLRAVLPSLLLVLAAACGSQTSEHPAHGKGPGAYALFLGDSISTGYQAEYGNGDISCVIPASMTTGQGGWVCVFVHDLRSRWPDTHFANLATNREDTCSFVVNAPCSLLSPGEMKQLPLRLHSQMADALNYLHQHARKVGPITFELGENDIVGPTTPAQIQAMEARVDRILTRLRRAAPSADLIVMDYPYTSDSRPRDDPFPAFYQREAIKYSALFVDLYAAFADHRSYVSLDGHPTDAGQLTIARTVWNEYNRWIGK